MSTVGKVLGAASVAGGMVGTAVLGGAAAGRAALRRYRAVDPEAFSPDAMVDVPADRSYSVVAHDGVPLYVEEVGPLDATETVIFAHGWTLQMAAWRLQRATLASPRRRLVFFDQRSHGKSGRAPAGHSRIDDLADDLATVIDTAAPRGPVVLVGHSMGGMSIVALAGRRPDLIAERVAAVALLSTSADEADRGWRALAQVNGSNPLLPWVASAAARYPAVAERGRRVGRGALWLATRALAFADPQVPGWMVDDLDEMISATPMDVIADFAPALFSHDERSSLPALACTPALIAVGAEDRMTPPARSVAMAKVLTEASVMVIPRAGHMAIMEAAPAITAALADLLASVRENGTGQHR